MAEGSPTVRRRELGTLLRKLREEQGLTVKQVTEYLLCSPSKVSRIETGQRGATLRDVRDLCDLYGVNHEIERARLMTLAREGKQQGWWQPYRLPYSTYVGLEAEATSIKDFNSAVVPGLLQTADYARALHHEPLPQPSAAGLTNDDVDQHVESRLRRQELLFRGESTPLELWAILDEPVLRRAVGGSGVMRAQLEQVLRMADLPNVKVQLIPFSVGAHPALGSTFNILEFDSGLDDVVYVEGLAGWIFLEKSEDINRYRQVFERLVELALSPARSIDLIASAVKGW